ncbi:molybdopterin molybdotransferase MoeA [Streptantibioticus cattleyicolor]|uniref:molybdopterin molybdotransferase MoeA n=1 Tax=Streptomyces sp. SID5468 TaxID=2690295 RepID=UPI000996D318|nr:molybdopterin molybdotransferase MoeA [Streptantibioticus cattleyicolor]MYS59988.1 molybdopterin molybdenumtransferase MoeA [Streptomyces sp. SID5468]
MAPAVPAASDRVPTVPASSDVPPAAPAGPAAPVRPDATPVAPAPPPPSPAPPRGADTPHHGSALPFPEARRVASGAVGVLAGRGVGLGEAVGRVLARELTARTDLPAFDTSAMDGWAVAGAGPWRVRGQVLAGQRAAGALGEGEAVRIATGAAVPEGATAVVRREDGRVEPDADGGTLHAGRPPRPGQDIRPRGQECRAGDLLMAAGRMVTPAIAGLAAAAGYDEVAVVPRPEADVLVLGDELLRSGPPRDGRVRDALGPLLPPWLAALGAGVRQVRTVGDDAEALRRAVTGSTADVVVTTGGTAAGPVDFVHPVLRRIGARLLVDGVAVRPGHPMLLALLPDGRPLVGLPGNPLAAVAGVVTLLVPVLRALAGRPAHPHPEHTARLAEEVPGHRTDTRLVPVASVPEHAGTARPLGFHGPAMLRGLAAADGMAVIPPGGAAAGAVVEVLRLGW